jgi:uncharacterized membrane protein YkvA (DUF1232 family)
MRAMLRLLRSLPAVAALAAKVARDPSLPRPVKIALLAAAVYLVSPLDLVPDVVPLLGYVDDLLILAIVLDGVLHFVDRNLLLRYWPGTERSLDGLARTARLVTAWVPRRIKERIFS